MEYWKAIKLYELGRIETRYRATPYSWATIFWLQGTRLLLREHYDESDNIIRVDLWDVCPPAEGCILRTYRGSWPSHAALNATVIEDGWLQAGDIPFYPEDFDEEGVPTFSVRLQ